MLYSEIKERSNRFIIALKIGFPFILLIISYLFLVKFYQIKEKDIFLLGLLSIIYIYYIFYLIYNSFKITLIDNVTKTFNRNHILHQIKKAKKGIVVMVKITNIHDINDRYGVVFADTILLKFAKELSDFLNSKNYHNVPIGRYSGAHFLVLIDESENVLMHRFGIFKKVQSNIGINGVEIKLNFALTSANYDDDPKNIIIHLLNQFDYDDETLLKPDAYDKLICESIDNKNFIFSYQPILDLKVKKVNICSLLVKLHVKEFGTFTSEQLRQVINRNGYEKDYEIKMIESLLEELKNSGMNEKIVIYIPSVVLRNNSFMNYIKDKVNRKKIDPSRFILSFYDKKSYYEITRFKEILENYKKLGFEIMIDRFGGNNASMEYIKWLPIDYAGFDLEFTKYLKKGHHTQVLKAYISLLKSLHVKTIGKFVETPYIYDILKAEGIDYLQGYMIGKPKMIKKIKNGNALIS